jgi:DNA topoisomerase III
VQTPTLQLIVQRQEEIDSFKSEPFFEVLVTFQPGFRSRYITPGPQPQTRLKSKDQAQSILKDISSCAAGTVLSVVTAEKRTRAPALYDLLTLQKEAARRYGFTAQETLDTAQSLYEEYKLISYPRTESRHISSDMIQELPRILSTALQAPTTAREIKELFAREGLAAGSLSADKLKQRLGKNYVDDAKLTDHHAIIPTPKTPPSDLPEKQRKLYEMVVSRFLSIFLGPEVKDETEAIIKLSEHLFRARGVVVKEPGWTAVESKLAGKTKDKEADAEEAQPLPHLEKGQSVSKSKAELKERKTTPPKPYDDGSLLAAMKNAGREIDDEDLAGYMKQSGLGTAATRAAIIERLLQTGYLERSKKNLIPTAKGRALISSVHADLKDVRLTASWEQHLADMSDGKLSQQTFEAEIAQFIRRLLPEVIKGGLLLPPSTQGGIAACPQCKKGVVRETPKGAGCNRWKEGCKFTIWREQHGKKLSDNQIRELVLKGRTKVIKGFKKKDGSGTYEARLVLNDEFRVRLEFD